ncbi:hypothetical protein HK104_003960 [Borealophlyctis nickersoniae]|nr:hypothetical protein HK104_003960 [Borealophlyctis nickersoniae]
MTTPQLRDIQYLKINWKANIHVNASGTQDYVIEHLQPGQFPILSYTATYGRLWGALTFEDICRIIEKNRGIYEILKADLKRSSWHVVLSNYFAKDLESMRYTLRIFARENGFDKAVYTSNRNFKCINQSKRGEPVQEYVEGSKVLPKHLVLHDFDEDAIDIDTIDFGYKEETEAKTAKNKTSLDILEIPQHDLSVPEHYDSLHAKPLDKLALLPNPPRSARGAVIMSNKTSWQVMLWCTDAGISSDNFWAWCRGKDSAVPRYKKYLERWNNSDKYTVRREFMDALLQRFYPEINMSSSTQRFQQQFDILNTKFVTITNEKYLQHTDISQVTKKRKHQEDDDNKESPLDHYFKKTPRPTGRSIEFSILAFPMGGNKTGGVVDLLRVNGKNWRVLWLTPRITLSENTMHWLKSEGVDVDNYKDFSKAQRVTGRLDSCQFLICCINSLHYTTEPFDLVMIDC